MSKRLIITILSVFFVINSSLTVYAEDPVPEIQPEQETVETVSEENAPEETETQSEESEVSAEEQIESQEETEAAVPADEEPEVISEEVSAPEEDTETVSDPVETITEETDTGSDPAETVTEDETDPALDPDETVTDEETDPDSEPVETVTEEETDPESEPVETVTEEETETEPAEEVTEKDTETESDPAEEVTEEDKDTASESEKDDDEAGSEDGETEGEEHISDEELKGPTLLAGAPTDLSKFTYEETEGGYVISKYTGSDAVVVIPSKINNKPVVEIGYQAFAGNSAITEVVLPSTVKTITSAAFAYCTNLSKMDLPKGLTVISSAAFADTKLKYSTVPSTVTKIGEYAFQDLDITSFTIPKSCTEFNTLAFFNVMSLKEYKVASGNTAYKAENGILFSKDGKMLSAVPPARSGSYTIPSGVEVIADSAFDHSAITSVRIPSSVTAIGMYPFSNSNITDLTIPASVKSFGTMTFSAMKKLKSIAFEESGVKELSYGIFADCPALQSVRLPSTLETLSNRAFRYTAMKTIDLSYLKHLKTIDYGAFMESSYLEKVILPESVETINGVAFSKDKRLISINLPAGLKMIGSYAFLDCASLNIPLPLPSGLQEVYMNAFEGTANAGSIKVPKGMTETDSGHYMRQFEVFDLTGEFSYTKAYEVLDLVNQERAKEGLSPLTMDRDLLEAAMLRAAETSVYFSHTRPIGTNCSTVSSKLAAENIAAGSYDASRTMDQWMNSSGHRRNIMSASYQSIGIGVFKNERGVYCWVQCFGRNAADTADRPADVTKTVTINAVKDLVQFELQSDKSVIGPGEQARITAMSESDEFTSSKIDNSSFKWTSSDESVAKVSVKGIVTAVKSGIVTITAINRNDPAAKAAVQLQVKSIPVSVKLNKTSASLEKGKTLTLTAAVSPSDAVDKTVTWSSSDIYVASVDQNGKVTAGKTGTATITAETVNGKTATCKVTVKNKTVAVKGVKLNRTSASLEKGKTVTLTATVSPANAANKTVTWTTSNKKIATVDQNGKVTAVKAGTATITAKTSNGKTATCKVTVRKASAFDPVVAFVTRLYRLCLSRDPDQGGLDYWVNYLKTGQKTAAEVVYGFFFSDEMKRLNLSNEEYVERCYAVMMDRASDAGGKKYWVEHLENGVTRLYVVRGFVESKEFTQICKDYGVTRGSLQLTDPRDQNYGITSFVARCYTKALGRQYDEGGLKNWCNQILYASNRKQAAIDTASTGFFHSTEFRNKNLSNTEYVKVLYRTFLGREYDSAGLKDWVGQLNRGASRDHVMNGFAYSQEFNKIMTSYGIQ